MATFTLVHGAWQSSATWDLVVAKFIDAGHRVHTLTLTGLGSDAQRLTAQVNLTTHFEDVLTLMEAERPRDVTLVGHSYAGMINSGVAEQMEERFTQPICVDAFVPGDG